MDPKQVEDIVDKIRKDLLKAEACSIDEDVSFQEFGSIGYPLERRRVSRDVVIRYTVFGD